VNEVNEVSNEVSNEGVNEVSNEVNRTVLVIASSSHVWVGKTYKEEGAWLILTNARCVRTWGTTSGLHELVGGPTRKTVLDDMAPILMVAMTAVIAIVPCQDAPWEAHL